MGQVPHVHPGPSAQRVWTVLVLPPILFLLVIVVVSTYYGVVMRGDAAAIAERTSTATPQILLAVQILMLLFLHIKLRDRLSFAALGWEIPVGKRGWTEAGLGGAVGAVLAGLYISFLSPVMTAAQRALGDYVPPGELLSSLGSSIPVFFIANVLLAPFVEENIYRGYALTALIPRLHVPLAVVVSCVFFGLLHWAGGGWYLLLTGVVAGGTLSALFVWHGNIVAAFAAHLTLNLIEFLFVWLA